jgi:DNA-binding NtrC family response regulator
LPPSAPSLLIVDEDLQTQQLCRAVARRFGYNVLSTATVDGAFRNLESQAIAALWLNVKSPDSGGLEPLRMIKRLWPRTRVTVMTASPTVESAVQAMRLGACDYLIKPLALEAVKASLQPAAEELMSAGDQLIAPHRQFRVGNNHGLLGRNPQIRELHRMAARLAQNASPVLIVGEPGTGKKMLAQSIHSQGPRKQQRFLALDCSSQTAAVLEQQLFQASTHAFRGHEAKPALAENGTLFLDEVTTLPLELQAKLLRAMDDGTFRDLECSRSWPLHARIIAASSVELETAVGEGRFRRDLYFRLNVVCLRMPALRERPRDIPLLAEHILRRMTARTGVQYRIDAEAVKALMNYSWPGNVGELQASLHYACGASSDTVLRVADFPWAGTDGGEPLTGAGATTAKRQIVALAELEKQAIVNALNSVSGDKLRAARLLGVGRTTLYRKLRDYGLG